LISQKSPESVLRRTRESGHGTEELTRLGGLDGVMGLAALILLDRSQKIITAALIKHF
jgi:hypothetical protein